MQHAHNIITVRVEDDRKNLIGVKKAQPASGVPQRGAHFSDNLRRTNETI